MIDVRLVRKATTFLLLLALCGPVNADVSRHTTATEHQPEPLYLHRCKIAGSPRWNPRLFRLSEIDRTDEVRLSNRERSTIRRIARKVSSPSLRFLIIPFEQRFGHDRLAVFNARLGDCQHSIPGYGILNASCNTLINPSEEPMIESAPSCIDHTSPM
jgi:hypothetical protein